MKFLFTTNPLLGHLLPMVPLIRAVRAAGHEIRVATGADLAPAVHRHGFPLWAVGPTMASVWAEVRNSADDSRSEFERARHDACVLFAEPGVARARQLMPMAAAWRPDVVVHELMEIAGWEAAAVSGAVDIVHGLGTHEPHLPESPSSSVPSPPSSSARPTERRALFAAPYLDPFPPSLQPPTPPRSARCSPSGPRSESSTPANGFPRRCATSRTTRRST